MGPDFIPKKHYDHFFKEEHETFVVGTFEGDYRKLLQILGKFATNNKSLLPFLRRGNDPYSMRYAILTSAIDIADSSHGNIDEMAERIFLHAQVTYGVPEDSKYAKEFSAQIAATLLAATPIITNPAYGPFWCTTEKYELNKKEAIASNEKLGVIFLIDGRLIALL